ncbi:MAG: hypothetical protein ACMXYK_00015 [Candidatus Woesearchaeota archaeon]
MNILGPQFLIRLIPTISLIIAAVYLVILSDYVNKYIVFPFAHKIKDKTKHLHTIPDILATIIFILYCYFGTVIVARYILMPILLGVRHIIVLILLGIFMHVNYIINTPRIRKKLFRI